MSVTQNSMRTTIFKSDSDRFLLDYTNRRKLMKPPEENSESNEERKIDNQQEFENVCLQIEECSISKTSSKGKLVTQKPQSYCSSTSSSCTSQSDIEAFQLYLEEHGGHYGGWKVKDHLFFIKIRNRNSSNKTAEIVHNNFPDINIDKVLAHDAWYSEYLRLRDANKKAIEKWRKTKKSLPNVQEKPEPKPEIVPVKRDPKIKQKIEIWKKHCSLEKQKRLQELEQEEERKKKEEEERKKMQEERRAMVNHYREEKINYEMAMKTAEEVESLQDKRQALQKASALLKYFRYEDRRFTDRQKAKRQQKMTKEEPKVRSSVQAKRDPNRLLQPTLGWIYHTKKSEESRETSAAPIYIQQLRHLGKPAWRQGMTA